MLGEVRRMDINIVKLGTLPSCSQGRGRFGLGEIVPHTYKKHGL